MASSTNRSDGDSGSLNSDQLEMWEVMRMDRSIQPTRFQTREQALNCAIGMFQYGCSLEVDPPSEIRILMELLLRGVIVLESPSGVDRGSLDLPPAVRDRYPTGWDFERLGCPEIVRMVPSEDRQSHQEGRSDE